MSTDNAIPDRIEAERPDEDPTVPAVDADAIPDAPNPDEVPADEEAPQ